MLGKAGYGVDRCGKSRLGVASKKEKIRISLARHTDKGTIKQQIQ